MISLSSGAPVVEAVSAHVSGSLGGSVLLSARICSLTALVEILWLSPQRSNPPIKPGLTWGRYMAHNITVSQPNEGKIKNKEMY